MSELLERLGFAGDRRVVIIKADELGASHATNSGVYESLRSGLASSASLMVPAPWSREAASRHRGEDVGVHLTLNAEHDRYRWGPITQAPSLLDGDGGFPRTVDDLWDHADLDEARRELRAQIERAILWGFDVSHLDSHLGSLTLRPEFFDLYIELALEFELPVRLPDAEFERTVGFPFRRLAAEEGVLFPDHHPLPRGVGARRHIERALHELEPGITELRLHPTIDSPEQRAFDDHWADRVDDHHLLCFDRDLAVLLQRLDVEIIGYRELREAQRSG